MKLLFCLALLVSISSLTVLVEGFSSGAPSGACDTLLPNPISHGADPQASAVPYSIDISAFLENGTYTYYPGQTYTLSVSGNTGEQFRGFFVQARLMSDDTTRVGVFTVTESLSRLSSCPVTTDGITHNTAADKTTLSFNWTAPSMDMGSIRFGFAVVQVRVTYWGNQRTASIQGSSGPTTVTQGSSGPTTVTQGSSGPTTVTQGPSGPTTVTQGSSGPTTATQGSSGPTTVTQGSGGGAAGLCASVTMLMMFAVASIALLKL